MRLMMSKSKSVARKIIVPSGRLSAGGHTRGRTSQISSTSSWPTMQRRAPSVEERRVRGSRRNDTACLKSLRVLCCVIRGYQCCGSTPHEVCDDPAQLLSGVLVQMISLC